MTDDELIELVVRNQVSTIQAQIRFRNNPMWMPSRTPEQKEEDERLWQQVIDRGLVAYVNELVKNKTEHIK